MLGAAVAVCGVAGAGAAAGGPCDGSGNLIVGAPVAGAVGWPCAHAEALRTRTATNAAPCTKYCIALSRLLVHDGWQHFPLNATTVFLIRRQLILQPVCAARIGAIANVWADDP